MNVAGGVVLGAEIYAAAGACAAAGFLAFGLSKISVGARGAYAFRALIVPGLILLWPCILFRWRRLARGEEGYRAPDLAAQQRTHTVVWRAAAILLPILLLASQALRPRETLDQAPVRLSPPAGESSR